MLKHIEAEANPNVWLSTPMHEKDSCKLTPLHQRKTCSVQAEDSEANGR